MISKQEMKKVFWAIPILAVVSIVHPSQADAWWDHEYHHGYHDNYDHGYRYYPRYPYGRSEVVLPGSHISVSFGGGTFFYSDGDFYRRHREREYIVVPAPVGVVISTIPYDCHKVIIDRRTYYTYNGVYYSRVIGGYQVVEPPSSVVVDADIVSEDIPVSTQDDRSNGAFTVNIPNSNGGYTAVTLKRSGSGFTGPQGEFYPEFPKVEQLRTMYGK